MWKIREMIVVNLEAFRKQYFKTRFQNILDVRLVSATIGRREIASTCQTRRRIGGHMSEMWTEMYVFDVKNMDWGVNLFFFR